MATATKRSVTNKTLKEKYEAVKELEKGEQKCCGKVHGSQEYTFDMEKAKFYAKEAVLYDFQAADDWIRRWKERYSVTFKKISGEASSVTTEMVAPWNET
eukprot:gene1008-15332_t